jgi:hypothetical protein
MLDGDFPLSFFGNPFCFLYLLLLTQILVNVVLSRYALPVISNFCTLGKLFCPLRVG